MLYFGYGSLVNRQTRDPSERYFSASLPGWERQWAHRARRPWNLSSANENNEKPGVCALTVAETENSSIDGVICRIDAAQIESLDRRESGYRRITLPPSAFLDSDELWSAIEEVGAADATGNDPGISIYMSAPENNDWANQDYPIPLSYVECVLAGFRQQFGEDGARRFMQTTAGWERPLFDDRKRPLYSRAVSLTAAEQQLVDAILAEYKTLTVNQ